jgi:uncharacterized protein (TIGR03545 family)
MPDFLIRKLKVDAALDAGKLTGKAENITPDQYILGKPTTFAFLGRDMKRVASLNLSGTANYVNPDNPKNEARMSINGFGVENLSLIDEGALPLMLRRATGDLNLNLETAGNVIDAVLKANFSGAEFDSQNGVDSALADAIRTALAGVNRFALNADVAGTLEGYKIKIASDLDRILKSAAGQLIKTEAAKFQAALDEKISAKLQGPMQQARGSLAGLGGIEKELADRLNLGDNLLKGRNLTF